MIRTISNQYLTVSINDKGAELWSVLDDEKKEYLWQGDPAYWPDRALNLFPYIGRMTGGQYLYKEHSYLMNIHGFAKDMLFSPKEHGRNEVEFVLQSSEDTLKVYPFEFVFSVRYILEGRNIRICYSVGNTGDKPMYFGVGGHPGFNVPLEKHLSFEDYCLSFEQASDTQRAVFSEDCFFTGTYEPFILQEGKRLKLSHDLFDDDAIVLKNMGDTVLISAEKGTKGLRVSWPGNPFLGIWHKPKSDAPYVCIEPWSSLPSRKGIVEDIEKQKDLICLEPGGVYDTGFSIEILELPYERR